MHEDSSSGGFGRTDGSVAVSKDLVLWKEDNGFLDKVSSDLETAPCVARMVRCRFQELVQHLSEDVLSS